MTPQDISKAKNPDVRGSLAAMRRAAEMARQIALQTNTSLVRYENGQVVRVPPERLREEMARNRVRES